MKKIFTLLSAALLCGAAYAATPSFFNYQGVADQKNENVNVTFELVDADGAVVYTQDATVQTNNNGVFTAKVGEGAEWENVDWGQSYFLVTKIAGEEVAKNELAAVPYALACPALEDKMNGYDLAIVDVRRAVEMQGVAVDNLNYLVNGLVADLQVAQDDIRDMALGKASKDQVNAVEEDVNMLKEGLSVTQDDVRDLSLGKASKEQVNAVEEDVATLFEDLKVAQDDIRDLSLGKASKDETNALWEAVNGLDETLLAPLADWREVVDANLDTLNEGLSVTQDDVRDLSLGKASKEQVNAVEEDVNMLKEGLSVTQDDVRDLSLGKASKEEVNALWEALENVNVEAVEDMIQGVNKDIEVLQEGLSVTQDDVRDLSLGKASKEQVNALEEMVAGLDDYTSQIWETMEESFKATAEELDEVKGGLDTMNEGMVKVADQVEQNASDIIDLQEAQNGLDIAITNTNHTIDQVKADINAVNEGLSVTQDDVRDLSLGKASKEEVEALRQALEDVNVEAVEDMIQGVNKDLDALKAGLDTAENDIADMAKGKASKEEVEALRQAVDGLDETLLAPLNDWREVVDTDLEALKQGLDVAENDIADMAKGKASKEEVEALRADLEGLDETLLAPLNDWREVVDTDLDALKAGLDTAENDIADMAKGKASKEEVEALREIVTGLDDFTSQQWETMEESFKATAEELDEVKTGLENMNTSMVGVSAQVEQNATDIITIFDDLKVAQDDIADMATGKASKDQVNALEEDVKGLDDFTSQIWETMQESFKSTQEALDEVTTALQTMTEGMTNVADQVEENANNIATLFDDLKVAQDDIADMATGKASMDALEALRTLVEELQTKVEALENK